MRSNTNEIVPVESDVILAASLDKALVMEVIDTSGSTDTLAKRLAEDRARDALFRGMSDVRGSDLCVLVAQAVYSDELQMLDGFRPLKLARPMALGNHSGLTGTGQAIVSALSYVQRYKHEVLRGQGIGYHSAFVIHVTDGQATDDLGQAIEEVSRLERRKSVQFFTVAIPGANLEEISRYTQPGHIIDLTEEGALARIGEVFGAFGFLSASSAVSSSGSTRLSVTLDSGRASEAAQILSDFSLVPKSR